jgi:hypothetical protein
MRRTEEEFPYQGTGREIRNNGFTNIIKIYFGKVNIEVF